MRPRRMGTLVAALLLTASWSHAQQGASPATSDQQQTPQTQTTSSDQTTSMETEVLSKMHSANQMEIRAGELARSKATEAHIRNYGDLLAKDHNVADKMIQQLASKQGITLTEPMPKSEDEKAKMEMQKQMMADLESASGTDFDAKFLQFNDKAHDMAVQMTTMATKQLKPGPVRDLVAKMVPILKQHDALASNLQGRETARK